jgi:thioredoxin-like negative regulator of GroEL
MTQPTSAIAALVLATALATRVHAAEAPSATHLAATLDRDGRLAEALPLYRARAAETLTMADRLRYGGALMRAGETDEARTVYAALLAEKGSFEHGDSAALRVATCASSILLQGFPALAAEVLRPALAERPTNRSLALLLARAQASAGDAAAARTILATLDAQAGALVVGERIELARAHGLTGDAAAARRLLDEPMAESVALMFRDSILADVGFRASEWARTNDALAAAARLAPATLDESNVNRAWRNAQRELRSLQLRRAVCLWRLGRHDAAADQALRAADSDEEYVRSAAIVLSAAADLADGRRNVALARLDAVAGHDLRFRTPVARLSPSLVTGGDASDAVAPLRAALAAEDRAWDFVTTPVVEILAEAIAGVSLARQ